MNLTVEVQQCAWCLSIIENGERTKHCTEKLPVSHGICNICCEQLMAGK